MTDEQSLQRNCQICSNQRKILKFTDIAQIREFCKYRDAREKFTALIIIKNLLVHQFRYRLVCHINLTLNRDIYTWYLSNVNSINIRQQIN